VLITNPNFLVLDEPTNDLDILTLNVLEEYLAGFKGCLIVISHDRYFMDKVVDHLLVFHGDARIQNFPGNYSLYRAWKSEEEKKEAAEAKAAEAKMAAAKAGTAEPLARQKKEEEKKKLTFKERQEYESLEGDIEQLEAEKEAISEQLSSGTLQADELVSQSERLSELIERIDEKTMRWLELSERVS
jgi:ATP-binding cassette subfamily F protein uup